MVADSTSPEPITLTSKRPLPDDNSPARRRKRNATACAACRARKTKCDNRKPRCSYCVSVGGACALEEPAVEQRFSVDSQYILDRIDRLEEKLLQAVPTHDAPGAMAGPKAALQPSNATIFCTIETVLVWPVFNNEYNSCLNLRGLMTAQDAASPTYSFSPAGRATDLPISLEIDSVSKWLDNFFSRIHIKNPILDEQEIRKWAREIAFSGFRWDAQSCLITILCALGAISMPLVTTVGGLPQNVRDFEYREVAEAWFEASQKRIGPLLSTGRGVVVAQCFFFTGVYLMHTLQPYAAWPLFLQALASCQSFKCLTKDTARAGNQIPDSGTEGIGWRTEESIYWTCFKSELELRCQLALPGFNISDLSYPDFLPTPPPEPVQRQDQAWFFYLSEIALRQLVNQVLSCTLPYGDGQQLYNLSSITKLISDFENQAEQWSQLLPPEVDIRSPTDNPDILRFILSSHLMVCYESMYWPYMSTAINFPKQRDLALDSFVQKGFQNCVNKIWALEGAFHHRHHGTWLRMRTCTLSALVLVAAKKCGQLEELLPEDWQWAVRRVIAYLDTWSDVCGDAGNRRDILEGALRAIR